jgi:hypothetical protein
VSISRVIALTNQAVGRHDWTTQCRLLCTLPELARHPRKHKHRVLSTTFSYLKTLNTLDYKWKFGQASDPRNIIP